MARRRKKRTLRPRVPARIKKRSRKKKTRGEQHPELIGLGLVALGIFLASVLYLGWNGGSVGGWVADAFRAVIGAGAYVAPVAFATRFRKPRKFSSATPIIWKRTGCSVTSICARSGTCRAATVPIMC